MRKFIVAAAIATVAMTAVPAAAQYQDRGRHSGWNQHGPSRQAVNQLLRDLNQIENRIQRLEARRAISHREAQSLRREANQIQQRIHRASRNGLSGREFGELRQRVNRLEQRVREERRDRDGRRW